MLNPLDEKKSPEQLLERQRRDWQLWSVLVLGVGVLGAGLAVWNMLRAESGIANWIPAILYGAFAMLVLGNFYLAQKDAIFQGIRHELIQQRIETELNRELALLDPVTEVYNRRYVRVILKREMSRAKRYGKGLSVMLVDITGFRRVNESLGQAGGDVVLRQIAHLLRSGIRNSDIIVRFGGDEFLLVLTDSEPEGVDQLCARLKEELHDWAKTSGLEEFQLKFAIGLAHYEQDKGLDELLGVAERRMLQDRRPLIDAARAAAK
jgi:diguanylate cyclase (GGDEF)-like protein